MNNGNPNNNGYVLKVQSDLVLTNVVVRDKNTGDVVRGLRRRTSRFLRTGRSRRSRPSTSKALDMATPLNEATDQWAGFSCVLGKGSGTGCSHETMICAIIG